MVWSGKVKFPKNYHLLHIEELENVHWKFVGRAGELLSKLVSPFHRMIKMISELAPIVNIAGFICLRRIIKKFLVYVRKSLLTKPILGTPENIRNNYQ